MRPSEVFHADPSGVRTAIASDHPGVRAFAASRAIELGLDAVVLKPLLSDGNWIVRAAAVRAIGQFGSADVTTRQRISALLDAPQAVVARLAVQAIGKVGDDSVVPALVARLEDNAEPLGEVIDALAALRSPLAAPALENSLSCTEFLGNTIKALGAIGAQSSVQPLIERFAVGVDGFNEWHVVAALRDIKDYDVVLSRMHSDPDPAIRKMLSRVAGHWWPRESAVRGLLRQLDDPHPGVRKQAAYQLRPNGLTESLALEAQATLKRGLEDSDPDVRHWCEQSLEKF